MIRFCSKILTSDLYAIDIAAPTWLSSARAELNYQMNLPTLPSPPTDSLYKFMALSGIILLVVAPFFWAKYYISQAERTHMALKTLRESIAPYNYYIANGKLQNGEPLSDNEKKLVEKYDALKNDADQAGSEFLVYDKFSFVIAVAAISLGVLGAVLTGCGFYNWYYKVQRPLDRLLLEQSERMTRSYIDVWQQLVSFKRDIDALWNNADREHLNQFIDGFKKTRLSVEQNSILLEEMHRQKLDEALNKISIYQQGKMQLVDYREHNFENSVELDNVITGIIDENDKARKAYLEATVEIERKFRKHLEN